MLLREAPQKNSGFIWELLNAFNKVHPKFGFGFGFWLPQQPTFGNFCAEKQWLVNVTESLGICTPAHPYLGKISQKNVFFLYLPLPKKKWRNCLKKRIHFIIMEFFANYQEIIILIHIIPLPTLSKKKVGASNLLSGKNITNPYFSQ